MNQDKHRRWTKRSSLIYAGLVMLGIQPVVAPGAEALPGSKALEWPEADLSGRLMDGAHQFVERKIAESITKRGALWARDFTSSAAYLRSIQPNRDHFK